MSIEVHLQALPEEIVARIISDTKFAVSHFGLDLESAIKMGKGEWNPPNRAGLYLFVGMDWQVVHFVISNGEMCFAGQSKVIEPIARAVMNAEEIGELNTGYGKIRLNPASVVARIAEALDALGDKRVSDDDLVSMDKLKIYPPNQQRTQQDATRIEKVLGALRVFYRQAADQRLSVIIWAD